MEKFEQMRRGILGVAGVHHTAACDRTGRKVAFYFPRSVSSPQRANAGTNGDRALRKKCNFLSVRFLNDLNEAKRLNVLNDLNRPSYFKARGIGSR